MYYDPLTQYAHDHEHGRDLGHKYNSYLFSRANNDYLDLALDISTPYFNVQGWKYLFGGAESQNKRNNLKVRLLLGAPPSDLPGENTIESLEAFADLDSKTTKVMTDFLQWLKNDKVEIHIIRSHYDGGQSNFLHAKTYLLRSSYREDFFFRGIIGSANLTKAGMQDNEESALFTSDHKNVLTSHKRKFEEWWARSENYKEDLIVGYEKLLSLSDPEDVYKRFLIEALPYNPPHVSIPEKYWLDSSSFSLKAHQKSAARQLQSILETHKGALLCDDVGLGKTYTAGALGRLTDFLKVHSVTLVYPKSVEQSWKGYLKKLTGSFHPREVTYSKIAREETSDWARGSGLLILDEAHMLRNSETKQFEKIKQAIRETGCRVLLLTATPVNNSLEDLHNLLSLFLTDQQLAPQGVPSLSLAFQKANIAIAKTTTIGHNTVEYTQAMQDIRLILSQVVVKRTRSYVRSQHPEEKIEFPRKVNSVPVEYMNSRKFELFFEDFISDFDSSDFEEGLQMAAYSPGKYLKQLALQRQNGDNLIARSSAFLMRLSMLKKMESSLEAFEHICTTALNNTRNRLNELSLSSNRIGLVDLADDDEEPLFTEDELMHMPDSNNDSTRRRLNLTKTELQDYSSEIATYRIALRNDENILVNWKKRIQEMKKDEDPKLTLLNANLKRIYDESDEVHTDLKNDFQKVIIFSSSLHTAKYIYDKLLKSFSGINIKYVSGRSSPEERAAALQEFSPRTMLNENESGYNRARKDQAQILITTDVLAEGVNLQQACHVINYDLTWNPMKMLQRVGRVDRMGSSHNIVENLYFFPSPQDVDRYLGLVLRLTKKMRSAEDTIGVSDSSMKSLLLDDASPDDKNYEYSEDIEFIRSQQKNGFVLENQQSQNEDPLIGNLQDKLFENRSLITEAEVLRINRSIIRGGILSLRPANETSLLFVIKNEVWGASKFFLVSSSDQNPTLLDGLALYKLLLTLKNYFPARSYKTSIYPDEWAYVARKLKIGQIYAKNLWEEESHKFASTANRAAPKKTKYESVIMAHLQNWQEQKILESTEIEEVKKFVESLRNDTSDAMVIKELYHRLQQDNAKDAAFAMTRIINQIKAQIPFVNIDYTQPPTEIDLSVSAWLAFDKKVLSEAYEQKDI